MIANARADLSEHIKLLYLDKNGILPIPVTNFAARKLQYKRWPTHRHRRLSQDQLVLSFSISNSANLTFPARAPPNCKLPARQRHIHSAGISAGSK
ncbi:hypothetical protein VTL71DRAFT_13604, partial [Oculimacula yallundae]